ncbi:hypothetical protein C475_05670 [Halosimplex carlsbadense 2-9-1]|uniref:Uncharacterized protein n=1 Tax=Halosimplex carlsbadense 2-9-1 TaxID=797114 RepID=M0CXA7_9EURY|nr:hypothetical protein [Halosimplex carlsbadense]ELZ27855.1 hypothetical protein C475_05670 [Halosimplex carlsbadense 2-9-1]
MDDALRLRVNAILGLSVVAVSLLFGLVLGRTQREVLFFAAGALVAHLSVALVFALARSGPAGKPDGR